MKIYLCSIICLVFATDLWCQPTICGYVTDRETGEALIGATVRMDSNGTATDASGFFVLNLVHDPTRLVISYVGYETKTIPIDRDTLRVELQAIQSPLNTAVVTASRYEQSPEESIVSLDILTSDEIEQQHTYSLRDGLKQLPGVSVVGGQPNIRGGSGFAYGAGSRVMLLIDGIPALQADAGYPNWDDIPVENIRQVEVVKGAGSALYGSAALNGVIHVRTKYATREPETEAFVFYRRYLQPKDEEKKWWDAARDGYGASLVHRRKIGSFNLSGSLYYTDEETANQFTYKEFIRSNVSIRYRFDDRITASISGNINTGNSGDFLYWKGNGRNAYLADTSTLVKSERTRFYLDPKLTVRTENGGIHKFVGRWHHVDNNVSNSRSNASDLLYSEYSVQRGIQSAGLTLQGGVTAQYTRGTAPLYGDTTFNMYTYALYAQIDKTWLDDDLTTSVGFRYESNIVDAPRYIQSIDLGSERFEESRPVIRTGINYELFEATHLRASYGEGYRFPTLAEKFITTDLGPVFISPNPELQSEYGWSSEVGISQGLLAGAFQAKLDAAVFWQEYDDMIEFVFTGDQKGFQAKNIGDTRIKGLECSVRFSGSFGEQSLGGLFGYTLIDPVYKNFSEEIRLRSSAEENILKYRSRHRLNAHLNYQWSTFSCGMGYRYASHQEAIDAIFLLFIPGVREYRRFHDDGYHVIDAWLSYQFKRVALSLKVNNVLNEEYSERPGLLEAPRNISIRLTYREL